MSGPVLEGKSLSFAYRNGGDVFRDLSFSVNEGELVFVLGANGAGKTTLFNLIAGELKPQSGEIFFDGKNKNEYTTKELYRKYAYVPQHANGPRSYTVLESIFLNLTGSLGLFKSPGKREIERAEEVLSEWKLEHLADKAVGELSGGESQLVRIAGAVAKEPKLLILDEPESGLDYRNQMMVLDRIRSMKEKSIGCLMNTHYPEHAFRYADRVLLFLRDHGEKKTVFGNVSEMITENNIKRTFGVQAVIRSEMIENTAVKSVVPIKIIEEKERL